MALDTFKPYLFVSAGEQSDRYLTPTITNGIARFQAQRAQELTGLTVRIDPIQEGTGDPSPENVRPISGRTGLTVVAANKNLAPNMAGQSSSTSNGIEFTYNDDGSVTLNGTATANAYSRAVDAVAINIYLPHGTYKKPVMQIDASHTVGLYVQYVRSASDWLNVTGGGFGSTTFTIDEDYPIAIRVAVQNGTTVDNVRFEPYIYPESVSDLTWVSPAKTTYPVSWQTQAGTIYGGTLDVVSGVLTVDKGYYTITDADSPVLFQTGTNANSVGIVVNGSALSPTVADRLNIMSNIAKAGISILTQSQQAVGMCSLYSTGDDTASKAIFGVPTTEDTAAKAIAWLITQECAFVYPLATPQTVQLDPEQILTIPGFNQIYSDAGPVIDIKF